ncbi:MULTISPECIES: polysaccharide deacetylase family protein [unclassified Sphingomonas]|uniref:polysaccharide deacetylase family protein n=1 Tax=unclassified Sphingomonas TaxID=196159 RepID=UPI0007018F30|nr:MULTISPECIES: polysaccharide deacetylase family protein [unclassified Sphingomonas]KQX23416.1 chitin deacetylase [Sphingomonas sp. Root1294]KQY68267.1 chitin deacetylase [Sphingomonas sp. Root50]KRB91166.1 chitin deacetylase [Sphingomonas sp. Root720]
MVDPRRRLWPDPAIERDFTGYGERLPDPEWPGEAFIAVNFNLNVEGGGELCPLWGDATSEGVMNDVGMPAMPGLRVPYTESTFEYGSRRGAWRLLDIFDEYRVPMSVLAVAQAFERNPALARACAARGHEITSHGYRWIDYTAVGPDIEREHIAQAAKSLEQSSGQRPLGWLTGRPSINTRRLSLDVGGFLYDRDCLNDELPYWVGVGDHTHLIVPYSLETNDNGFDCARGFNKADDFFIYMRDAFDALYREGQRGSPRILSIALHDRLIGRPGRSEGLRRLLDHMRGFERVWFCRGVDIARHWRDNFPAARG